MKWSQKNLNNKHAGTFKKYLKFIDSRRLSKKPPGGPKNMFVRGWLPACNDFFSFFTLYENHARRYEFWVAVSLKKQVFLYSKQSNFIGHFFKLSFKNSTSFTCTNWVSHLNDLLTQSGLITLSSESSLHFQQCPVCTFWSFNLRKGL